MICPGKSKIAGLPEYADGIATVYDGWCKAAATALFLLHWLWGTG